MPLSATGVIEFRKAYPTYDGRGVLIGILDSGIDPGIPGLSTTSTGERKILDLRDFSGEGEVKLEKAGSIGRYRVDRGQAPRWLFTGSDHQRGGTLVYGHYRGVAVGRDARFRS
jgi:hypothetical protein